MTPRSLTDGKERGVDGALEGEDAGVEGGEDVDGAASVGVGVIEAVVNEGEEEGEGVDKWVDEEKANVPFDHMVPLGERGSHERRYSGAVERGNGRGLGVEGLDKGAGVAVGEAGGQGDTVEDSSCAVGLRKGLGSGPEGIVFPRERDWSRVVPEGWFSERWTFRDGGESY